MTGGLDLRDLSLTPGARGPKGSVHAASWTTAIVEDFPDLNDRLQACGYGVPNERLASECAQGVATIIVEDAMPNPVIEEEPKKKPPKKATTKTTEPNKFGRRTYHGLDLKWNMQGPQESEQAFMEGINALKRPKDAAGKRVKASKTKSFDWEIGINPRSRGTIQSDQHLLLEVGGEHEQIQELRDPGARVSPSLRARLSITFAHPRAVPPEMRTPGKLAPQARPGRGRRAAT